MRYLVILSLFVTTTGYAQPPKFLFRQPDASAPAPLATLITNALQVSGITPGAQVYGFTVSAERKTYYANVATLDTLLQDTDRDGIVTWSLQRVPERSLWFAVDMISGGYAAAVSSDYRAKRLPLKTANLTRTPDRLSCRGGLIEFIVIRPTIGSWQALVPAGSMADLRLQRNAVTIALTSLSPGTGTSSPPPTSLRRGDVIVFVNITRGEYRIGSIDEVTP